MIALAKWSVEDYHRMIAPGILRDCCVELLAVDIVYMSPEGSLHASRISLLRMLQDVRCKPIR